MCVHNYYMCIYEHMHVWLFSYIWCTQSLLCSLLSVYKSPHQAWPAPAPCHPPPLGSCFIFDLRMLCDGRVLEAPGLWFACQPHIHCVTLAFLHIASAELLVSKCFQVQPDAATRPRLPIDIQSTITSYCCDQGSCFLPYCFQVINGSPIIPNPSPNPLHL